MAEYIDIDIYLVYSIGVERSGDYGFEAGDICVRMMEKCQGMPGFIPALFHKRQ